MTKTRLGLMPRAIIAIALGMEPGYVLSLPAVMPGDTGAIH